MSRSALSLCLFLFAVLYWPSGTAALPPAAPTLVEPTTTLMKPVEAYTEIFYVTQAGTGSRDGSSSSNAWAVSDFNDPGNWSNRSAGDGKIGPNDLVWLSGTITSPLVPKGDGTEDSPVVLAGDGTLRIAMSAGGGRRAIDLRSRAHIHLFNPFRRAVIDGGVTQGDINDSLSNRALVSLHEATNIHIDNWEIRNGWRAIHGNDLSDLRITNSHIHHMRDSGIYIKRSDRILIRGNKLYRITYKTGGINVIGADIRLDNNSNTIISHNQLHGTADAPDDGWGMIGIALYRSTNSIVEYNTIHDHGAYKKRSSIHVKSSGGIGKRTVIRFNNIHSEHYVEGWSYTANQAGIKLARNNEHVWVYGNRLNGLDNGFWVDVNAERDHSDGYDGRNVHSIYFWANLLSNIQFEAIVLRSTASANTDVMYDVVISNNTIHNAGSHGIYFANTNVGSPGAPPYITIANNIVVDSMFRDQGWNDRHFWAAKMPSDHVSWTHNVYYESEGGGSIYVRIGNSSRSATCWTPCEINSSAVPSGWFENHSLSDPKFSSPESSDFSLSANSPALSGGTALTAMSVDGFDFPYYAQAPLRFSLGTALRPSTNWNTHPPVVEMGKQEGSWVRGAYLADD